MHRNNFVDPTGKAPIYVELYRHLGNDLSLDEFTDTGAVSPFPSEGALIPINPPVIVDTVTNIGLDGNVYISTGNPSQTLTEYGPWEHKVIRTISTTGIILSFAADKFGRLYVEELVSGDQHLKVFEYRPGATSSNRSFDVAPVASNGTLGVSPMGDIYVAYIDSSGSKEIVKVFKPDTQSPAYSFSFNSWNEVMLAFDGASNLYINNRQPAGGSSFIYVYPPGTSRRAYGITLSSSFVDQIAVDQSTGTLYALNNDTTIIVYARGATTPSYTIPAPAPGSNLTPNGIAVDPWNNLYASYRNHEFSNTSTIALFAPGSATAASHVTLKGSPWGIFAGPIPK